VSQTTSQELAFLDGVASFIQTQIDPKQNKHDQLLVKGYS
jgi:hypothetical protein